MTVTTLLRAESVSVIDYCCIAGPADKPYVEVHRSYSIAYVRRGSFGIANARSFFELVAARCSSGHPGDEYMCTHDHHAGGDECLSFHFSRELVETFGDRTALASPGRCRRCPN